MANLPTWLCQHCQHHPLNSLVIYLLLITISLIIFSSAEAAATTSKSNPLNNFFACQQRHYKAITECSAGFGGQDSANKQLTSGDCCKMSRYTNCIISRAVVDECSESLASLKEQMLSALKQNCPNLACSGAAYTAPLSILALLLITLLTTFVLRMTS